MESQERNYGKSTPNYVRDARTDRDWFLIGAAIGGALVALWFGHARAERPAECLSGYCLTADGGIERR